MRLSVASLCDAASVREGLLHILGAGVTRVVVRALPAPLTLDVALMVTADLADVGSPINVTISLYRDGDSASPLFSLKGDIRPLRAEDFSEPDIPLNIAMAVDLTPVVVDEPQVIHVLVDLNGEQSVTLPAVVSLDERAVR